MLYCLNYLTDRKGFSFFTSLVLVLELFTDVFKVQFELPLSVPLSMPAGGAYMMLHLDPSGGSCLAHSFRTVFLSPENGIKSFLPPADRRFLRVSSVSLHGGQLDAGSLSTARRAGRGG